MKKEKVAIEESQNLEKEKTRIEFLKGERMAKDKCVSCGVDSLYEEWEHIDNRIGYIEGSGQLCLDCFDEIYNPSKKTKAKELKSLRQASREWWKDEKNFQDDYDDL